MPTDEHALMAGHKSNAEKALLQFNTDIDIFIFFFFSTSLCAINTGWLGAGLPCLFHSQQMAISHEIYSYFISKYEMTRQKKRDTSEMEKVCAMQEKKQRKKIVLILTQIAYFDWYAMQKNKKISKIHYANMEWVH